MAASGLPFALGGRVADVDDLHMSSVHSPDGRWWWSGDAWYPAVSLDGRWRFDGSQWVRRRAFTLEWPAWLIICLAVWLIALAAWLPVTVAILIAMDPARRGGHSDDIAIVTSIVVAVALCLAWGFMLGWVRYWTQVLLSTALGSVAVLVSYVGAMIAAASPTDTTVDNAAGAGVVIIAVPTFAVLAVLLAVGAGLGRLARYPIENASRRNAGQRLVTHRSAVLRRVSEGLSAGAADRQLPHGYVCSELWVNGQPSVAPAHGSPAAGKGKGCHGKKAQREPDEEAEQDHSGPAREGM